MDINQFVRTFFAFLAKLFVSSIGVTVQLIIITFHSTDYYFSLNNSDRSEKHNTLGFWSHIRSYKFSAITGAFVGKDSKEN